MLRGDSFPKPRFLSRLSLCLGVGVGEGKMQREKMKWLRRSCKDLAVVALRNIQIKSVGASSRASSLSPHFNNSWILGPIWQAGRDRKTLSSCQQWKQMTGLRGKKSLKKKADDPCWIPRSCLGIRSYEMSLICEESSILILHVIRQQRSKQGFISSASHRGFFLISSCS